MIHYDATIALIGRPNVGKSALFNRMLGHRLSIVEAEEGVTRDRLYGHVEAFGHHFCLIDTGGILGASDIPFADAVYDQAESAIEESDHLFFVVDGQVGLTSCDEAVAQRLHHAP
ncbi:MAG: GTPase, partial [Chlamydiota bacterium]|nr:GTPase [Chlamydiota bacterium]